MMESHFYYWVAKIRAFLLARQLYPLGGLDGAAALCRCSGTRNEVGIDQQPEGTGILREMKLANSHETRKYNYLQSRL